MLQLLRPARVFRPPYLRPLGVRCNSSIAFVFDIDGVLLRGKKEIPGAGNALRLLDSHHIPWILLTNGGGISEKARVEYISQELDIPISPHQIVQSHTPMKKYARDKTYHRVMVVGGPGDSARHVALDYGFKDVITPGDIVRQTPSISPHHRYTAEELAKYTREVDLSTPVDAVLVFNDPRDVGTDLQIVLDLLNSKGGVIGTLRDQKRADERPAIPIVFSNNDFVWANEYPLPRFGQGAFRLAVEAQYSHFNRTKGVLQSTILGKPFKIQYDYAHSVLVDWNKGKNIDRVYMVGDNPESDIKGANDNGWESILLRSGVFKDADWDTIVAKPTAGLYDNVFDAVLATIKERK